MRVTLETMANPQTRPTAGSHLAIGLDGDTRWHMHDVHQLIYAFDGSIEVETERARTLLPRQLAAWIPAGTTHRVGLHRVRTGSVFFAPALIAEPGRHVRILPVSPLMREMIAAAMRWPIAAPTSPPVADAFFAAMALLCAEWIETEAPLSLPQASDVRIARAMDATRLDPAATTLADAIGVAGMSERSFRRHFGRAAGMTWESYRRRARLARAIMLLADGTLTIAAVAGAVGFDNQSAFAEAFRRMFGESPQGYRRRLR